MIDKINYNELDKYFKQEKANRRIRKLDKINFYMIRKCSVSSYDLLENLLVAFEELEPNWVNIHNSNEQKKPEELRSVFDENTTIKDILSEAEGDDITELALSSVVANRIAHSITDIIKNKVRAYSKDPLDKQQEYKLLLEIRRQFSSINRDNSNYNNHNLENECKKIGISINQLKKDGIDKLVKSETVAFYLKEYSLQKMLTELKSRPDINYGIQDTINKNGKKQKAFVMDLPYYGQFSIHLMPPKLESQASENTQERLKEQEYSNSENIKMDLDEEINLNRKRILNMLNNRDYEGVFFEKSTIIPNSSLSEKAEEFLKSLRGKTQQEQLMAIREIKEKDPRYGHYLEVKGDYNIKGDER